MPRGNRYMLPGEVYHLTHRCHNKDFLLRFGCDRTEYCRRLRNGVREFGASLFSYSITKNHTHLLARAKHMESISELMHKVDGGFASYYNRRKSERTNAFWGDRFHATMIESGGHLLNCMAYIDLNMVPCRDGRAPARLEVVRLPGANGMEVQEPVSRSRAATQLLGFGTLEQLRAEIGERVQCAIRERLLERQRCWTEGVAVGSEPYVKRISAAWSGLGSLPEPVLETKGVWAVYELGAASEISYS